MRRRVASRAGAQTRRCGLGTALVYTGEHSVTDLFAGLALALAVQAVARAFGA